MMALLLTAGLALANGAGTSFSVQHSAAIEMRHCGYQMYGTTKNHRGPAGDYAWNLVPALNGNTSKSTLSFQSSDFPNKYASIISSGSGELEAGRLGVVLPPADKNDASFEQVAVAVAGGGSKVSFKSMSTGKFAGMFLTLTSGLQGSCSSQYKKVDGEGDVVLAAGTAGDPAATWTLTPAAVPPAPPTPPPPGPVSVSVAVDKVTHQISPLVMGCHSDSGYAHQARGFYSQMIVGDSFNATGFSQATWNIRADPGVAFSATMDEVAQFYGTPSEKLVYVSGKGLGSLSNRGLGNAGMFLKAGKVYEGFVFAKVVAGTKAATLTVALDNYVLGTTLDSAKLTLSPVAAGNAGNVGSDENGFARYNFTLTPSVGTSCVDIAPGSDPEVNCGDGRPRSPVGHTCVKCGGEFKLSLDAPSSVLINYVFLQPGAWGRVDGLPVLASAASVLKQMGVKAIRQGGSYASVATGNAGADYYQWQKWSGPAWTRPSRTDGVWKKCLLSGWGPFEMIDLCNALDIEPVITTTETSTTESFADLVEYAWGNTSTKMGAQRTADGHPAQYRVKYFELGNEQYNPNYVEQVAAMEAKAVELGMGGTFHYMFPQNNFLNQADLTKAAALIPRLDSQMVADVHIGGGGAVEAARRLFASNTSFKMGAVNAETNAGTHVFSRASDNSVNSAPLLLVQLEGTDGAMSEAADLNDWFNAADVADRLHFRAASFCMGDSTDFDSWDQGISFFLPNMTWLQPPGYVHQMVDSTWQPNGLNVMGAGSDSTFSAQKSDDGKTVVLRYVNYGVDEVKVTVTLTGESASGSGTGIPKLVQMWTIASDDPNAANSPANPTAVSPVGPVNVPGFASGSTLTLQPASYTVVVMNF